MPDIRRSFLLSFADSYLALLLNLCSTVVLARLLTPAEVGVFAIAAVFSTLASTFRDFGVAEYLIQAKELDRDRIRAALAMNIMVSWLMALALYLVAPAAAAFYREAGVGDVMRVLALNFVLVPFGAVVQAWFRREMNFRPIVLTNVISSVSAFAVTIGLALLGHGFMSMAWGTFAGIVGAVLASAWFRPREMPRWPGLKCIAEVFHFGKFASGIYIFGQLGRGAPELVIGRVAGAADVGIFSRANGLVEMFHRLLLKPVLHVCLPYFAQAKREQGEFASTYQRSVAMLTAVGWPFLALLGVAAYALIRIVYGAQWMAAVPLAQVLSLACAIELLFLLSREALLAVGEARRASILQLQIVASQLLGLALTIPFGLPGAAWGMLLAAVVSLMASQWHLQRGIDLSTRALLSACWPSAKLALAVLVPLLLLLWLVPLGEHNYVRWLLLAAALTVLAWLATLRTLAHPLWAELTSVAARTRAALSAKRRA